MAKRKRNYKKETAYENTPAQVARRVARNRARRKAIKQGKVRKGDGLELDHVGYHRTGSLSRVATRVVPRGVNRRRQPDRPGGKSANKNYSRQRANLKKYKKGK
jgi:hypothetical protein